MRDKADRAAEQWFVRRMAQPDMSDAAFSAWLMECPEHEAAWRRTTIAWAKLGSVLQDDLFADLASDALIPSPDVASPRLRVGSRERRAGLGAWWSRSIFARAALALAVVAVASVGVVLQLQQRAVYETGLEGEELVLRDGSKVNLDRDSRIGVSIGPFERTVELFAGRALFEVAQNARKPFAVNAGRATIVATGTSFQVDRESDEVSVSLLEGTVFVSIPDVPERVYMEPGSRLEWRQDEGRWTNSVIDPRHATAWTRGFLEFDNTRLADAVREINRYAEKPVHIADPSLNTLIVSGSFRRDEPERFAAALPHVLPVKTQVEPARIVISRK